MFPRAKLVHVLCQRSFSDSILVATPYLGRMKYVQKLPSCLVGRRPMMRTMQVVNHDKNEKSKRKKSTKAVC